MIEINGKVYRNLQEQVEENIDDIEDLDTRVTALEDTPAVDAYTKAQSDAKFQTIAGMSSYATKSELNNKQDTLTAGNGIDITSNEISVDTNVLVIDSDNNLNKTLIRTSHITSLEGEDVGCKGEISLGSGTRSGSLKLEAEGEESNAEIYLRGTTTEGSEGTIEISGKTTFNTNYRINVYDGSNTEQIAYLSDLGGSSQLYEHNIMITYQQSGYRSWVTFNVINTSSTEYTELNISSLTTYLAGKGYNYVSNSKMKPANGISGYEIIAVVTDNRYESDTTLHCPIIGITVSNNQLYTCVLNSNEIRLEFLSQILDVKDLVETL